VQTPQQILGRLHILGGTQGKINECLGSIFRYSQRHHHCQITIQLHTTQHYDHPIFAFDVKLVKSA
jgi:hypothetical protein